MTIAPGLLTESVSAGGLGITTRRVESDARALVSRGGACASSKGTVAGRPAAQSMQTSNRVAERDVAGLRGWEGFGEYGGRTKP
jgi:hypothetical protein